MWKLFLFSVLKLAVVPLVVLALFVVCGGNPSLTVALVCVTMCAAPTASNTAVVAEVYGGNAPLAAKTCRNHDFVFACYHAACVDVSRTPAVKQ